MAEITVSEYAEKHYPSTATLKSKVRIVQRHLKSNSIGLLPNVKSARKAGRDYLITLTKQ